MQGVLCVDNLLCIIHLVHYFPRQCSMPDNFCGMSGSLIANKIIIVE
jgi:hypothetical protein